MLILLSLYLKLPIYTLVLYTLLLLANLKQDIDAGR